MQSLVCSIWGSEGTWKTSHALSWVKLGKLVHYEFDIGGYDRASWRLTTEQQAIVANKKFPTPIQLERLKGTTTVTSRIPKKITGVKELWQRFVTDYVESVQQADIKTIVFDSATKLWSIVTRAYLQELQEKQLAQGTHEDKIRERLGQIEYGEPNDRMGTLIYTARSYSKNLLLIHYPRDKYREFINSRGEKESLATGEIEPDGFKETRKLVDLELHTSWEKVNGVNTIQFRIENKCGLEGVGTRGLGLYLPTPDHDGIDTLMNQLRGV